MEFLAFVSNFIPPRPPYLPPYTPLEVGSLAIPAILALFKLLLDLNLYKLTSVAKQTFTRDSIQRWQLTCYRDHYMVMHKLQVHSESISSSKTLNTYLAEMAKLIDYRGITSMKQHNTRTQLDF